MAFKVDANTVIDNQKQFIISSSASYPGGMGMMVMAANTSITEKYPVAMVPIYGGATAISNTVYSSGAASRLAGASNTVNKSYPKVIYDPNTSQFWYVYQGSGTLLSTGVGVTTTNNYFLTDSQISVLGLTVNSTSSYGGGGSFINFNPNTGIGFISYNVAVFSGNTYYKVRAFKPYSSSPAASLGTALDLGNVSGQGPYYELGGSVFLNDANNSFVSVPIGDASGTVQARLFSINANTLAITAIANNNNYSNGTQRYVAGVVGIPVSGTSSTDVVVFYDGSMTGGLPFCIYRANSSAISIANSGVASNVYAWNNGTSYTLNNATNYNFLYDSATNRFLTFFYESTFSNCSYWACYQYNQTAITQVGYGVLPFGNNIPSTFSYIMTPEKNIAMMYRKVSTYDSKITIGKFDFVNIGFTYSVSNVTYFTGNSSVYDVSCSSAYNPMTGMLSVYSKDYSNNQNIIVSPIKIESNYRGFIGIAANAASAGANVVVSLPGSYVQGITTARPYSKIYVDPVTSNLTSTPSAVQVGYGLSGTEGWMYITDDAMRVSRT